MYVLTVGELKSAIKDIEDNVLVVINMERDHQYEPGFSVENGTALLENGTFTEDIFISNGIGEETEYGKRIKVLIIGA